MDREVALVAERQHGVFTYGQALLCGFTVELVKNRLRSGRWQGLADGVYRLPGTPPTWAQGLMALTLAAGPAAAASHRSAAALLGIPGFERRGLPEVTTPRPRRHRCPAGAVHRWRAFPDHHLTVIEGITTTRVGRTLVDLAGVLHPGRAERAVDNCLAAKLVTLESLGATFADMAGRGRAGIGLMRGLLEARGVGYVATASELEDNFLAVLRSAGLPEPVRQLDAGGADGWAGRVDFAYPERRLLIELDSRRHHSAMLDLEADRRRDNRLVADGWRVVRITWEQLHERPDEVVVLVRRLLSQSAA